MTGVFLILIGSVVTSISQYLFKKAADGFDLKRPSSLITNPKIAAGLSLYVIYFGLTIVAYKYGDMVVLFPLTNLSLVWSLILARWLLKESVSTPKVVGTAVILLGCIVLFL